MNEIKIKGIDEYVCYFLLLLFPIISQYNIKGLVSVFTVGYVILLFFIMYIINHYSCINIHKSILVFACFIMIHDVLNNLNIVKYAGTWLKYLTIFLFMFVSLGRINEERFYKVWKIVGIIWISAIMFQSVQVYVLGNDVGIIKIPFLYSDAKNFDRMYNRPHGLFMEPAAYVTNMLPLLFLNFKHKDYIYAIINTFSILLTTSTTGIVLSAMLWVLYIFTSNTLKPNAKVALISAFIFISILFLNMSVFSEGLNKLATEDVNNNARTNGGYIIFRELSLKNKILGIQFIDVKEFLLVTNFDLSLLNMTKETTFLGYTNAISYVMICYGIIGLLFYIYMFAMIYKDGKKEYLPLLVICVVSQFGQSVFINNFFVVQFIVLYCMNKFDNNVIRIKLRRGTGEN